MYIGPWQEYKLYNSSKLKSSLQAGGGGGGGGNGNGNGLDSSHLKAELQAAILSSLDAESAKKAIEAMNPLLDNIKENDRSSGSGVVLNIKPKRKILQPISKSTYYTDSLGAEGGGQNAHAHGHGHGHGRGSVGADSSNSNIPTLPSLSSIYSAR